jgi:hypothetical protein
MDVRGWYEADALMADLTSHRYEMMGASEDEVERRMRDRYPNAVVVLVREERRTKGGKETGGMAA